MLTEEQAVTPSTEPSQPPTGSRSLSRADRGALATSTGMFAAALVAAFVARAALPTTVALGAAVAVGSAVALLISSRRLVAPVLGGLAWWSISAATTVTVLTAVGTNQHQVAFALLMAIALMAPTVLYRIWLDVAAGRSWGAATADVARVFVEPTGGVAAALIGVGASLPLIGTYAPVISDTDSASLARSTLRVREDGISLLRETQEGILPHLTLSSLLAIDGYRAAVAFAVVTMVGMCALAGYLGYKVTGRGGGALVSVLVLLSIPWISERADRLPMYAVAYVLAYGAGWVLHRSMAEEATSAWGPVLAGAGLVLASEAHGIANIFLAVPFLLLFLHPWSSSRRPLFVSLGTIAVLSIPRTVLSLSGGSFVNGEVWERGAGVTPSEYLADVPGLAQAALGRGGILFLVLTPVVVAYAASGRRARMFGVAAPVLLLAILVVVSPEASDHYLTPLAVGLAMVVAAGVTAMTAQQGGARLLGCALVVAFTCTAFLQVLDTADAGVFQRETVYHGPWPELAATIDDDRSVIGVRSIELMWGDHTQHTEDDQTMDRRDWKTYITWPSDDAVAEVLEKYGAGWIYLSPNLALELADQPTFLDPPYGVSRGHVNGVATSADFCLAAESGGYLLYRYGDCRPGDLGDLPPDFLEQHFDPMGDPTVDESDGLGDPDPDEDLDEDVGDLEESDPEVDGDDDLLEDVETDQPVTE